LFIAGAATTVHGRRFSLRTLLIVMTIAAVLLGLVASTVLNNH
jgi:hypothetical protein